MANKMNREEIKLIAEFMGMTEYEYPTDMPEWVNIYGSNEKNYINFRYHSSWDWLMPVVEKIGKEYDVRITWQPTAINVTYIDRPDVFDSEISSMGGMTALENTYRSVVKFIEWFNKNKKKRNGK